MTKQFNYHYNPELITKMCRTHAKLTDKEIESILEVAKVLPYMAATFDADMFIDIIEAEADEAIVIAEHLRSNTVFTHSYIGERILRKNEPAIFQSYYMGERISSAVAVSIDKQTGNTILSHQTCVPILADDKPVAVISSGRGILREKYNQNSRQWPTETTEAVANLLFQVDAFAHNDEDLAWTKEGMLVFNRNGYLEYYNASAEKIYKKLGHVDISDLNYDSLSFATQNLADYLVMTEMRTGLPAGCPYKCGETEICVDGRYYSTYLIIEDCPDGKVLLCIRDCTSRYRNGINTKDYLVTYQEIHHRIKNNLQTVASLLRLQMNSSDNIDPKLCLSESINRILSIASTYEILSKKRGDEALIKEMIQKICANTASCYAGTAQKIKFFVKGDNISLDSERSVVVSLIVAELIQNAVKHAFVERSSGEIVVDVSAVGDICRVKVTDNGVGYQVGAVKEGSLGAAIVNAYVEEKLQGLLEVVSDYRGTSVSFEFSLKGKACTKSKLNLQLNK